MLNVSTILKYPMLTILSTGKKSFENLGRFINKSGDTISRMLQPASASFNQAQKISTSLFKDKKKLFCIIDDTLIKKIYSRLMQGSGMFFDTKIGRRITAFRLILCMVSDGKFSIPIDCGYLFAKELIDLIDCNFLNKEDFTKIFVGKTISLFPHSKIIFLADGLYATVKLLTWCKDKNISAEMRMHSNRIIEFRGKKTSLKGLLEIPGMRPKGRKMARTITAKWHGMELEITIVRRIDKHGDESIVFQVATYKVSPSEHVRNYKNRWPIEETFRTSKQYLGLQECFSRKLKKQHDHVAAVFLAYALAQYDMKKYKFDTPEEAIKRLKAKIALPEHERLARVDRIFQQFNLPYA